MPVRSRGATAPHLFEIFAHLRAEMSVDLGLSAADHAGMRGALLCLLSAAAFGTLGIFGRLASDAGASIAATLFVRFAVAAAVFWVVLQFTGGWRRMRALPRHVV